MVISEELLKNAQDAGARLQDIERDTELIKVNYHHAIRQLHLAGGSLREIATALNLSHQRVHQIIHSSSGGWRQRWSVWRKPDVKAEMLCSLCGSSHTKVTKLIPGPGFNICNRCITAGTQVLSGATAASKQRSQLTPIIPGSKFRCSFCGRGANDERRLLAGTGAQICSECLAFAHEILTEKK